MLRDEMLDLIAAIAEGITAGECVDAMLTLPVEGWETIIRSNTKAYRPATLQEVIEGKARRMVERRVGWMNVWPTSDGGYAGENIYPTKEAALKVARGACDTIKIEYGVEE